MLKRWLTSWPMRGRRWWWKSAGERAWSSFLCIERQWLSSLMPHHIVEVLSHIPSSRLLIGSDVPESLEAEMSKILGMDLAPEVKSDILWNTARRLFDEGRG